MSELQDWCDNEKVLKARVTRLMGEFLDVSSLEKIQEYIILLEDKVIDISKENEDLKKKLKAVKHNRELTIKWARGEMEN